jgi:arylformamidase
MIAMIAWLFKEAPNFGADPSKIFIAGHSAGGHQAAILSITNWANNYGLPKEIIKGGIAISGIFDLQPLFFSYLQPKLQLTHKEILN